MHILGPDALVFGVDDVAACYQYLTDDGLHMNARWRSPLRCAR